jgi:hypothetical protein
LTTAECNTLLNGSVVRHCAGGCITSLSFGEATFPLSFGELTKKIVLVLIENAVPVEECLKILVVDPIRIQLKVDPLVESDRTNLLHIARARTEGEPIERVNDLLVCRELTMIES